jgi:hypothetical protein
MKKKHKRKHKDKHKHTDDISKLPKLEAVQVPEAKAPESPEADAKDSGEKDEVVTFDTPAYPIQFAAFTGRKFKIPSFFNTLAKLITTPTHIPRILVEHSALFKIITTSAQQTWKSVGSASRK